MEKLSLKSYGWKCVLGMEVVYFVCLFGGFLSLRSIEVTKLHHMLFETLPGFTWINIESIILGSIYSLIFSWIFAVYMVWMHNSSLVKKN